MTCHIRNENEYASPHLFLCIRVCFAKLPDSYVRIATYTQSIQVECFLFVFLLHFCIFSCVEFFC